MVKSMLQLCDPVTRLRFTHASKMLPFIYDEVQTFTEGLVTMQPSFVDIKPG